MSEIVKQVKRMHIIRNLLVNSDLPADKLYDIIMENDKKNCSSSRKGFIFETLSIILIITKCLHPFQYDTIYKGKAKNLKKINDIRKLFDVPMNQGDNIVDLSFSNNNKVNFLSIKYRKNYCNPDLETIDRRAKEADFKKRGTDYSLSLIVKDKKLYLEHKYHDDAEKILINEINHDKLLLDEKDIINAITLFSKKFSVYKKNNCCDISDFIDYFNQEYFNNSRQHLIEKFHQNMSFEKFIDMVSSDPKLTFCINHKCRSGKTILILMICKYLLENKIKKNILIVTSILPTINDFITSLNKFIEFKDIKYIQQDEFSILNENFNGIVFCSAQFLKTNSSINKKKILKQIDKCIVFDESHLGSSTDLTYEEIITIIDSYDKNNKFLKIFASATSDKTIAHYNIPNSCISIWSIIDEANMKILLNKNKESEEYKESYKFMINRHGKYFETSFLDNTLNKDYSKCPIPVLMKYSFPNKLVEAITDYNLENNTKYGISWSSLLALVQSIDENGNIFYKEQFELEQTNIGIEILKSALSVIASNDYMEENTIMTEIEKEQFNQGSRMSTKKNPLLFLLFLPTHCNNSVIDKLQKTLIRFIKEHGLWKNYNLQFSNANSTSGDEKEHYNEFITSCMNKTIKEEKLGCILLLGDQGNTGITYHNCDVTISLDDSKSSDLWNQRQGRSLTEAPGKTIGINVDMNVQRSFKTIYELVDSYRKSSQKNDMSNSEILYYMYSHQIFRCNPNEFKNGIVKTIEIKKYYEGLSKDIISYIDHKDLLSKLTCENVDKSLLIQINKLLSFKGCKKINKGDYSDFEGTQPDLPKGERSKTSEIDVPNNLNNSNENIDDNVIDDNVIDDDVIVDNLQENKLLEICKNWLFGFLTLLSTRSNIIDYKQLFRDDTTILIITDILRDKKIINEKKISIKDILKMLTIIMDNIIDENLTIINNLREIYANSSPDKYRELLYLYLQPSEDEKKNNAEHPTPPSLVDNGYNRFPPSFWNKPKKIFDPCCGKGNFVIAAFDKFNSELSQLYPDNIERCKFIINKCLYYNDISYFNIFITTELLKLNIQTVCGICDFDDDWCFNSNTGDALKLDIKKTWGFSKFDGVVMNPPFNSPGKTATGNVIWHKFVITALHVWLEPLGLLLSITPRGWRKPNTERGTFYGMFKLMTKENQMLYLSIHGIKDGLQTFKCGTNYDWYLIQKKTKYTTTNVNDEKNNEIIVDMNNFNWLPNYKIDTIQNILAKKNEDKCPIIYDRTSYGADKKDRVSENKNDEFKYPCIHSTPNKGTRYRYSNVNNRGHFGVSKVIFGETKINPVIDMKGEYGMTHGAMAIKVDSLEEANNICNFITSDKFNEIINSCMYSNFRIDWNIFTDMKKDFWKI